LLPKTPKPHKRVKLIVNRMDQRNTENTVLENVSNALSEDVAQKLAQISRNLPFQKEMKGAMRQKAMGREHETVRMK